MSRSLQLVFIVLTALLFAGCSSLDSRIHANQATFNALDPATQQKIRQQIVEVGYTPDMVYMAYGEPTKKTFKQNEKGSFMTWSYQARYDEYEGSSLHYRRAVAVNPRTGQRVLVERPVVTNYYSEQSEEMIRVEFKDGKVTSIEQTN
jgi:hypothetical protein